MRKLFLLTAVILGVGTCLSTAQSTAHAQTDNHCIAVLKNGQMLEGKIVQLPGEYSILTDQGSRLVLAESQVDFTCTNKIDAYWQKNARIKATNIVEHRRLFYWCLKYKLLEQAQNQIDIISILPIKASDLDYLNRQVLVEIDLKARKLEDAQLAAAKSRQRAQLAMQAVAKSKTLSSDFENNFRPLPSLPVVSTLPSSQAPTPVPATLAANDSDKNQSDFPQVAQVGFSEPIKRDAEKLSIHELDELTKSLPKPAVAFFKRKIEPLIVRSCFAGGCHQANDDVMPLTRVGRGRLMPRRMSQRNLSSILKHADPNEPLSSPLLTAAITSHGDQDRPVVRPGTIQYENLATWLIMVSNKPNSFHAIPKRDVTTLPGTAISVTAGEPQRSGAPDKPGEQHPGATPIQPTLPPRDTVNQNPDVATQEPQDPRDPDVFNKKFGRKKNRP